MGTSAQFIIRMRNILLSDWMFSLMDIW